MIIQSDFGLHRILNGLDPCVPCPFGILKCPLVVDIGGNNFLLHFQIKRGEIPGCTVVCGGSPGTQFKLPGPLGIQIQEGAGRSGTVRIHRGRQFEIDGWFVSTADVESALQSF